MIISVETVDADGTNPVDSTVTLTRGSGTGGPYTATQTDRNFAVAAGRGGVLIAGDAASMPAQGIQRLRIFGKSTAGAAWTQLVDIDYTTLADASPGTTLGDGLTDVDGSYYVSGGRLRRNHTTAGGNTYKPRYLASGSTYLYHKVEIVCDSVEGSLSSTPGYIHGVHHYNVGASQFLYGGYRYRTGPVRELAIGYANFGADPTDNVTSVTADPGSGGTLSGGALAFGSASGYASVSGNVLSITAPTFTGGVTTPSWQWYYATTAQGTKTAISGAGGTGDTISALAWTVPSELRSVPLFVWCEVTDGSSTLYLSHHSSSSATVRTPAYVPKPTVPTDQTLAGLAATISFPVSAIKLLPFGDSISSTTNLAALYTVLNTAAAGKFSSTIPATGHAGSRVEHWLRTATIDADGVSQVDGTKNNFDGAIAAVAAWTGPVLIPFMLGTNNNTYDSTLQANLLQVWADIQNGTYGRPGAIVVAHQPPVKYSTTDVLAAQRSFATYLESQASLSGDNVYLGSTDLWGHFADNKSQISDGTHPSGTGSGSGQDSLVRFWAKAILEALAVVYPGATYSGVTITNGATATVTGEGTLQLAATVQGTNSPSQTVTWSIVSGTGTVDETTGLFTAPGAGQTDKTTVVKATAVDGVTYDTISITTPAAGSGGEVDTTAPTVLVAEIGPAGNRVEVYFSEPVTGTTGFTLKVAGTTRSCTWSLIDSQHLRGTISGAAVLSGVAVTLDYAPGTVEDTAGNALAGFTARSVSNYSTQSATPIRGGLRRRPHTFVVYAPSEDVDASGGVETPTYSTGTTVLGQVEPLSSSVAYEQFGLEIQRAYRVLVNLDGADYFVLGALVECASRSEWYRVVALPLRHDAIASIAHAEILVQGTTPSGDPI